MATYSSNTTLKVSAAVAASALAPISPTTVYTCPANAYAVLNLVASKSGTGSVTVGGIDLIPAGEYATPAGSYIRLTGVHVGPGQTVVANSSIGNAVNLYVSGVAFINTP